MESYASDPTDSAFYGPLTLPHPNATSSRPRFGSIPPTLTVSSPTETPVLPDQTKRYAQDRHHPEPQVEQEPKDDATASKLGNQDIEYGLPEGLDDRQAYHRLVGHPRLAYEHNLVPLEEPPQAQPSALEGSPKSVIKFNESPQLQSYRRSWHGPNLDPSPRDLAPDPTVLKRRSWEPNSLLDTPPFKRRQGHRGGAVSLDFSSSELSRRSELMDYERALDAISNASSSPRTSSFPTSSLDTGRVVAQLKDGDSSTLPSSASHWNDNLLDAQIFSAIPAITLPDESAVDMVIQSALGPSTRNDMLDLFGEEAANVASDLNEVRETTDFNSQSSLFPGKTLTHNLLS